MEEIQKTKTRPSTSQCRGIKCPDFVEGKSYRFVYRILLFRRNSLARCRVSGKVPGNMAECPAGRL
jgi:hypothetical protein